MIQNSFLEGRNISLRPFHSSDISPTYLSWLNDSEVNKYSGRRYFPTSESQAKKYLNNLKENEMILAICKKDDGKHIGNIKFGPINFFHKSAEISILIGDKLEWGKGYASESIYLLVKHLFQKLNLNRIESGSINPAFSKIVIQKLGWTKEGVLRKAFIFDGKYVDIEKFSILKDEFHELSSFEPL